MKKLLLILLLFVPILAFPQEEEDNTLEINLNTLLSDLNGLNNSIQTYDDIASFDYEFQEAGNRLKSFAAIIAKDSPLYDTYDLCNHTYYTIQKRIESLQDDHERQHDYDNLMDRFQQTIVQLGQLKEQGEGFVANKQPDSLAIVKKKATRAYLKASSDSEAQKSLMEDPTLQQLWDTIEQYNEDIEELECRSMDKLYESAFRIVMVALALFLVINTLRTKVKAKKMSKQAQQQMSKLMGNDDAPVLTILLLLFMAPLLHAQEIVLDYPRYQPGLDTVFVDFKVVDNGHKLNLGTIKKESVSISETGYNGNNSGTTLVDVLDIRNYDPDYAAGNYSLIVLADRSVTAEQLQSQRQAITEIFQGFPKAHFYLAAMDEPRTPTAEICDYYQLTQWLDTCFNMPSANGKFIYKALASVMEECSKSENHDFYPEVKYNADLKNNSKKVILVLTNGVYKKDDGTYIGEEDFFRIKMTLISEEELRGKTQVKYVYFGDNFIKDDFRSEVQYVSKDGDHFYPDYDFQTLKEDLVMHPDPTAMDYRMVITNLPQKLYDGQKITLYAYLQQDDIDAFGSRSFTKGSLLDPVRVHDSLRQQLMTIGQCLLIALILMGLLYVLFRITFPRIKYKRFRRRYVKRFDRANLLPTRASDYVGQKCYYCKETFQPGDEIVTRCEHTMHYDCWKENGHQCPEFGKECDNGNYFYNEDHRWDPRNAPHFLKWLIAGCLAGLVSWLVFRLTTHNRLFYDMISDMVMLSQKVGVDASGEAFVDKIHDLLFFGSIFGFIVTLVASWLVERRKKTPGRIAIILLREVCGFLVGFVAFFIGGWIALAAGKDYNNFLVDIIPWLLMGAGVGFVIAYRATVSMKRAVLCGFLFAMLGFGILYMFSFDGSNFEFHYISLLASLLCLIGVMVFAGGLYACIAIHDHVSKRYFLHIEGSLKSRDVAIYKWMNRTGGYRVVTIGRSDRCYIDMDWDNTEGLDGVIAEIYIENDVPYYKVLSTNQTIKLKHGTSFRIGKTIFTYIEKDRI